MVSAQTFILFVPSFFIYFSSAIVLPSRIVQKRDSQTTSSIAATACSNPCVFSFFPIASDIQIPFGETTTAVGADATVIFAATTLTLTGGTQPSPITVQNEDPKGTPSIPVPSATFGPFTITGTRKEDPAATDSARLVERALNPAQAVVNIVNQVNIHQPACPAPQAATPGNLGAGQLETILCDNEQVEILTSALAFTAEMWNSDFAKALTEDSITYKRYFPPGYGAFFQKMRAAVARNADITQANRQPLKFICVNPPSTTTAAATNGWYPSLDELFNSPHYCKGDPEGSTGSDGGSSDGSDEGSDVVGGAIAITTDHSRWRYLPLAFSEADLEQCSEVVYLCPQFFRETLENEDYMQNPQGHCSILKKQLRFEWDVDTGEMSKILGHELTHVNAIAKEGGLPGGTNAIIFDDADFQRESYYRSGVSALAKRGNKAIAAQNADTFAVMVMEAFWRGTCNLQDTAKPPNINYADNPKEGPGPDGTLLPLVNIAQKYFEPFFLDPQVQP
ncbi:hypothetical protein NA57DRAFT_53461 [Rhizodiscina lignyota]|uniref:Uncharacterized protein n=1 Tax=Rhizodiscina lignyota TaxID=1504668 RepID=A0A9P4M8A7_9PEZI|nr:hypothetical protein NA57DRAFT_53461 [Rhizodiscina lignyota]